MSAPRGWIGRWLALWGGKEVVKRMELASGAVRPRGAEVLGPPDSSSDLAAVAIDAGGAAGLRLRARVEAALEAASEEDGSGAGAFWLGRGVSMSQAALRAWLAKDASRPAAGFYEWASDPQRLADWVEESEAEALRDEQGRLRMAWTGLRAYVSALPGHQMGQPVSAQSALMHGYVAMQCFGGGPEQWRYEELLCDEPELFERLARAGVEPSARPGKEEAQAALAFLEGEQIAGACEGAGRKGAAAKRRAQGARL